MNETKTATESVELSHCWRPGGAQGNKEQLFLDGDQYLFAVRLVGDTGDTWDFHTVIARCDSDLGCHFETTSGDSWSEWSWSDVEWFIPCRDLDLPYISQNNPG